MRLNICKCVISTTIFKDLPHRACIKNLKCVSDIADHCRLNLKSFNLTSSTAEHKTHDNATFGRNLTIIL